MSKRWNYIHILLNLLYSERDSFLEGYKLDRDARTAFVTYSKRLASAGQAWLNQAWKMKLEVEHNQVLLKAAEEEKACLLKASEEEKAELVKKAEEEKAQIVKEADEETSRLKAQLETYKQKYGPLSPAET